LRLSYNGAIPAAAAGVAFKRDPRKAGATDRYQRPISGWRVGGQRAVGAG